MKNKDRLLRKENNKKANELILKSRENNLTLDEIETLKTLHTGYGGLGENTQYFTPQEVVDYMIKSLDITGFNGKTVLEPACGNGIFLNSLLNNYNELDLTAVELNFELFNLTKICYPKINLINGNTLDYYGEFKNKFDLVIGNPPYGRTSKNENLKLGQNKLESQFTEFCLDCLKPGGHFIMVLPTSILSLNSFLLLREKILNEFVILQSIDLPNETFLKSDTSVSTSIVHLRKKEFLIDDREHDYNIVMKCINSVGWDSRLTEKENELIDFAKVFKDLFDKHKKDLNVYFKEGYND